MLRDWTGDWIGTFMGHKGAVWSSKLSLDTARAVTGTLHLLSDGSGAVRFAVRGENVLTVPLEKYGTRTAIVTGDQTKKIRIFDLARPDADPRHLVAKGGETAHEKTVKSVVWLHDGRQIVSAGEDGVLNWWDLRTTEPAYTVKFPSAITSLELSAPTGTLVLTHGNDVAFYPVMPSSSPSHNLTLPHAPSSASLHPTSGDRFVAGSTSDPWVRVYGLVDGNEMELYKGHHGPVHTVQYSPDGEMYASGSEDGTIRLWQTVPGKTYGLWQGSQA
ncbi:11640_t:CDS:2 [Acaulospora colombiana]|uniref:11640_t:CDS:1 n=1 Tax=Acaulospora colombiana TaxID=27376 RepID=A0ACA9L8G4_9GLOM|nr:11640_t:CDS:2 [Acaulospora colombiana]